MHYMQWMPEGITLTSLSQSHLSKAKISSMGADSKKVKEVRVKMNHGREQIRGH